MIIAGLIPHTGAMCLLDDVETWDAEGIVCRAVSHLDARNPLRRAGRLSAVCGVEYAMQAAALHGALLDQGRAQPAGRVASIREVLLYTDFLDDPALGPLRVEALLEHREPTGLLYRFTVSAGRPLLEGRAAVSLPK